MDLDQSFEPQIHPKLISILISQYFSEKLVKLTSTKSFSTLESAITALYRQDRSPKPRSVSQTQDIPIPRVKRAAPSGRSFTFLKFPGFKGFDASLSSFSSP
jgi:hypothetical protein